MTILLKVGNWHGLASRTSWSRAATVPRRLVGRGVGCPDAPATPARRPSLGPLGSLVLADARTPWPLAQGYAGQLYAPTQHRRGERATRPSAAGHGGAGKRCGE